MTVLKLPRRLVRRLQGLDHERLLLAVGSSCAFAQMTASEDFKDLWDAEFRVFSQFGEDGILNFLCDRLGLFSPSILEIGAGDFSENNSRFLIESRMAKAVVVDVSPDLRTGVFEKSAAWKTTVIPAVRYVNSKNAHTVLEYAVSELGTIDILSLDIDGLDFWVMKAIDRTDIKVVVVEYNALFGSKDSMSVPDDDRFVRTEAHYSNLYYGASLRAYCELMEARSFCFAGTNRARNNAFFVRKDLAARLRIPLPSVDNLELYCESGLREARDPEGKLTYQSRGEQAITLQGLPVINTRTGESGYLSVLESGEVCGQFPVS